MAETQPDFPIWGDILWLTPEQGGRASGPPPTPWDRCYEATAFVPPRASHSSLASIVVDVAVRDAWASHAKARWLAPPGPPVDEGSVVMITEGPTVVAVFTVTHVERPGVLPDQPRPPLSAGAIALIEARADAASAGPWQSFVEGRDHVAGDSFIMTGTSDARGPDLYLTWAPRIPHEQRAADQDFIAHARQDIPELAAHLRELREWLDLDDAEADGEGSSGKSTGTPAIVYIVQTDPSQADSWQLGAFKSEREALKALLEARRERPQEAWVMNGVALWERFADYQSGR